MWSRSSSLVNYILAPFNTYSRDDGWFSVLEGVSSFKFLDICYLRRTSLSL